MEDLTSRQNMIQYFYSNKEKPTPLKRSKLTHKKTCCVTGHRPKGFPWAYGNLFSLEHPKYLQSLQDYVVWLVEKGGYDRFISGCATGVDSDFAEICIHLRDTRYPHICVEGAIPFEGVHARWKTDERERFENILARLDEVNYLFPHYSKSCFQKRNEYMVDQSSCVLAVWNLKYQGGTYNTIYYAKRKQKDIQVIDLTGFIDKTEG